MPDRKGAIPPRPGPNRRASNLGRKARSFPAGAAWHRLRRVLWPPTISDSVLAWLNDRPGETREETSMLEATAILRFVRDRIESIYERPLMYGGEGDGVDLILHDYHELWGVIVERRDEFEEARLRAHEESGTGSMNFSRHYRERIRGGEADLRDVLQYVVGRWRAIDEALGISTRD